MCEPRWSNVRCFILKLMASDCCCRVWSESQHMACVCHSHQCKSRKFRERSERRITSRAWHSQSPRGEREVSGWWRKHSSEHRCDPSIWTLTFCEVTELRETEETEGVSLSFCSCSLSEITPQLHSLHTKHSDSPNHIHWGSFPFINKLWRASRETCLHQHHSKSPNALQVQHTNTSVRGLVWGLWGEVTRGKLKENQRSVCSTCLWFREKRKHVVDKKTL